MIGNIALSAIFYYRRSGMPRQARLDAPGTLHHVRGREREGRVLLTEDTPRAAVLGRRTARAESGALTVDEWALLRY